MSLAPELGGKSHHENLVLSCMLSYDCLKFNRKNDIIGIPTQIVNLWQLTRNLSLSIGDDWEGNDCGFKSGHDAGFETESEGITFQPHWREATREQAKSADQMSDFLASLPKCPIFTSAQIGNAPITIQHALFEEKYDLWMKEACFQIKRNSSRHALI